jgi:hypothetical protein
MKVGFFFGHFYYYQIVDVVLAFFSAEPSYVEVQLECLFSDTASTTIMRVQT